MYYIYTINMKNTMKNTRFSLQTDIENKEVTLMCHFKLEGVMNHSTMHVIPFTGRLRLEDNLFPQSDISKDKDGFKSMCAVFGVSQKLTKEFIDTSIMIAMARDEDVIIEHELAELLRHPDSINRIDNILKWH